MPPEKLCEVVKTNVKARRLELGLTQVEVAEKIGCKQPVIAQIERGTSGISMEMLAKLSDVLRTTPAILVTPDAFSFSSVA